MKYVDIHHLDHIDGIRLGQHEPFSFQCRSDLGCFNRCCRNLNLFLYPYDVIRLKNRLGISSDQFLETYVDMVLRKSNFFPEVILRMSENQDRTCIFVTPSGCSVYTDRPDTCRKFPMEMGMIYDDTAGENIPVYFFRPPDFCLGAYENKKWTPKTWLENQQAEVYTRMTIRWASIKRLFQNNPWGTEGPYGQKGKMAFMATYNVDRFRDFIYNSSFLKRYNLKPELLKKIRDDDVELLKLGFEWVQFFIWGIKSRNIRQR